MVADVTTVEATIPGPNGNAISAIVYTPTGPGPFPVVVYFHGGGWVTGTPQAYDLSARALAKDAQAVVISVDYRLAPENKFPAAWDDALTVYKWTASTVGSWRGDPRRLALAGEGAGGNLAISTALAAVGAYPTEGSGDCKIAACSLRRPTPSRGSPRHEPTVEAVHLYTVRASSHAAGNLFSGASR